MFCIPIVCGMNHYDSQYTPKSTTNKGEAELPPLQPYQYQTLYCPHCHNNSVHPIKRKEFFTIWFIPLVPIYWGKQLRCNICNWAQDFKDEAQLRKVINEQQNVRPQ